MRKQARRLWFGDWHRDEEPADDTVVISQVEDETAEPEPVVDRRRNVRRGAILAAGAIFIAAVIALSSGGDKKPLTSERATAPPAQQTPQAQPQVPQGQVPPQATPPQGQGFGGGADLTGAEAQKAAQAALSQYPGSIERVTRDQTGAGYIVHVIDPDGYETHVLVDGQFHVQGSDGGGGRGPQNQAPGSSQ